MRKRDGLLFIGDPHVTAAKPGRRLDEDFLAVSIGKLKKALAIAEAHNLEPVILGDLVNKAYERAVLHDLIETLIDVRPCCLVGNHPGSGEDTTLGILMASRAIRPLDADKPVVIEVAGGTFHLFGADYGTRIPTALPVTAGATNILITHHDLEFSHEHRYPGQVPPPEVKCCGLAVNGHIHDTYPPVQAGETQWHNPGNILRQTVDKRDHVPVVMALRLVDGAPLTEMIALPGVQRHVFEVESIQDVLETLPEVPRSSDFALALASSAGLDRPQSDDGDELATEMRHMLNGDEFSDPVKQILLALHDEVAVAEEA